MITSEEIPFRRKVCLRDRLKLYRSDLQYLSDTRRSTVFKNKRLAQISRGPMSYLLWEAVPLLLRLFPK